MSSSSTTSTTSVESDNTTEGGCGSDRNSREKTYGEQFDESWYIPIDESDGQCDQCPNCSKLPKTAKNDVGSVALKFVKSIDPRFGQQHICDQRANKLDYARSNNAFSVANSPDLFKKPNDEDDYCFEEKKSSDKNLVRRRINETIEHQVDMALNSRLSSQSKILKHIRNEMRNFADDLNQLKTKIDCTLAVNEAFQESMLKRIEALETTMTQNTSSNPSFVELSSSVSMTRRGFVGSNNDFDDRTIENARSEHVLDRLLEKKRLVEAQMSRLPLKTAFIAREVDKRDYRKQSEFDLLTDKLQELEGNIAQLRINRRRKK